MTPIARLIQREAIHREVFLDDGPCSPDCGECFWLTRMVEMARKPLHNA